MGANQQILVGNSRGYVTSAVDFNGTTQYASVAAGGTSDGKKGTFVQFFRIDGGNGTTRTLRSFTNSSSTTSWCIRLFSTNVFQVVGRNSGGTVILNLTTSATFSSGANWIVAAGSWDLATAGARHLYINDASDLVVNTFTNDTINYNKTHFYGINHNLSTDFWNGCMGAGFFDNQNYLDLSNSANRYLLYNPNLTPRYLGATGTGVFGSQPLDYEENGDPTVNSGSLGAYTVTAGPLSACSSHP